MLTPSQHLKDEIDKWRDLRELLEAHELDEQTLFDTLDGETDMVEAVQIVANHIADISELIAGIAARQADLAERKARLKKTTEDLRATILLAMSAADKKKIVTPECTLSVSKRTPAPEITNEAEIPAKFWVKQDPVIDRHALTTAVKALGEGETIAGVKVGDPISSLTIRRK